MFSAKYNSSQGMNGALQSLKFKINLKIYANIYKYYDELKYRMESGSFHYEEDIFRKNEEKITKLYPEIIILLKNLQTKPQVKKVKFNFDF